MTRTDGSAAPDPIHALQQATALQAALYAIPIDGMWERLSREAIDPDTQVAAFNEYAHGTHLATPTDAPFRAPNNDTLYSTAWLDLRHEPAILTVPDTGGRYHTAQCLDLTSETIANVGARLCGTAGGHHAIVGPGWDGDVPPAIDFVVRSSTSFVAVLLRILVDGPDDVPAVRALQQGFTISSLSRFRDGRTGIDPVADEWLVPYHPAGAADRLAQVGKVVAMDPVRPGEEGLLAQMAVIGVGPAKVNQAFPPDAGRLEQAWSDALTIAQHAGVTAGSLEAGWRVMRRAIGTYGFDIVQRAAVWAGGPLANVIEESLYPSAVFDVDDRPLTGQGPGYVLRFAPGQTPPARFFWSLTIYRMRDGMLVPNPIERYSIGNRTKGLVYGDDGSLSIFIERDRPSDPHEAANWLPAPDEPFYLSLRLYGPEPAALSGAWRAPAIRPRG